MLRKLFTALTAFAIASSSLVAANPASATDYLGCSPEGRGTVEQPYWICSASDFQQIVDYDDHVWALTRDIDFTGVTINPALFRGELMGNGYALKNVTLDANNRTNVGLFSEIVTGAYVHDVELKNFNITGASGGYVGLLAGNISGRVERVKVGGSINLNNGSIVGGLAGQVTGGFLTKNVLVNTSIASATPGFIGGVFGAATDVNPSLTPSEGLGQMQNIIFNGHIAALTQAGSIVGNMNLSGDPDAPLCVGTSSVFSVEGTMESQSGIGCTHQLPLGEIQEATRETEGFQNFDTEAWLFGDSFSLPILRAFPEAPGRPGVPSIMPGPGGFIVTFGGGFNGGSQITSYTIQIRRAGEPWSNAYYQPVADFSAFIDVPEDGIGYQVRVRTTNAIGDSEWVEARELARAGESIQPISLAAPQLVLPAMQDYNSTFTRALTLQDGKTAVPWIGYADDGNIQGIGVSRLDDQGRPTNHQNVAFVDSPKKMTFGSYGRSMVQTTDGDIVLVWIETDPSVDGNRRTSKLFSARSSDGYSWTVPVQVGNTLTYFTRAAQCQWEEYCGYTDLEVQADGSNGVAVMATYPVPTTEDAPAEQPAAVRLVSFSNLNTAAWSQETVVATSGYIDGVSVVGLKAGFLATWTDSALKSAFMAKPATGKFTTPKSIGTTGLNPFGYLVQRNATTVSEVWIEGEQGNTIRMRDYNLKTKRWATTAITLATYTGQILDFTPYSGQNGNIGLAYAYGSNNVSTLKYVNVINGKTVSTEQTIYSGPRMVQNVDIVQSASDSAVVAYTLFNDEIGLSYLAATDEKQFAPSIQVPTIMTSSTGTQLLMNSRGKIMQVAYTGQYGPTGVGIEATAISAISSPVTARSLSITGLAKVGKTLAAATPEWTSYSPITSVKYAWYRCNTELDLSQGIVGNCIAIPKANKSKYKLTKADKGKYITFATTAVSVSGTSRQFANVTSRVG